MTCKNKTKVKNTVTGRCITIGGATWKQVEKQQRRQQTSAAAGGGETKLAVVTMKNCPACDMFKPEIPALKRAAEKQRRHLDFAHLDYHKDSVTDLDVQHLPWIVLRKRDGTTHTYKHDEISADKIAEWMNAVRSGALTMTMMPEKTHHRAGGCTQCGVNGVNGVNGGVDPKTWGPPMWFVIHLAALTYDPTTQRSRMISFFSGLRDVLPCETCRRHFSANWAKVDTTKVFASRESLFAWTVELHNSVTKRVRPFAKTYGVAHWKRHYKNLLYGELNAWKR